MALKNGDPRLGRPRGLLVWMLVVTVMAGSWVASIGILSTQTWGADQPTSNDQVLLANNVEPTVLEKTVVHGKLSDRTIPSLPLEGKLAAILPTRRPINGIVESTELYAQHGIATPGVHFRLKNTIHFDDITTRESDALLLVVTLNNNKSWGSGRSVDDFFALVTNFTHPQKQTSVAILTSCSDEFKVIQQRMRSHIHAFTQFNLILRHDFKIQGLTRENRHAPELQAARRGMLARYRNFLLLSVLETWHQHVLWLDADIHIVPPDLPAMIIHSGRDIVEPRCNRGSPPGGDEFDYNAWFGNRQHMDSLRGSVDDYVHLDSVGGTMLYVRADIHRQGVVFPHFYLIGGAWEKDGFDAIETEGLCYAAHFLGYKCWGMPNHIIYHVG